MKSGLSKERASKAQYSCIRDHNRPLFTPSDRRTSKSGLVRVLVLINPKHHWFVPAKLISKTRSPLWGGDSSFEEAGGLAGTRVQRFLPFDWSVLEGINCSLYGACGMSSMIVIFEGRFMSGALVQRVGQGSACARE
jgi:hypothetical protein